MELELIKELSIGVVAILGLVYVIVLILKSAVSIAASKDAIITQLLELLKQKEG